MAKNIVELIFKGDSKQVEASIGRAGKTIETFGRKTVATFGRIGRTIGNVSDKYLTRFNSLIGGAAILYAGKGVIDFDARLARLAISAGKSGKEFFKLKSELFAMAKATHQTPGELLEGISAIVERTGNYDFAIKSLRSMGIIASATGASMEAIGATTANLMEKMGITSGQVFEALDVLNIQAKAGAVEFKTFAPLIERLTAAAGRFNLKGIEGVRILGAWVQSAKKASGSADEATTGIEMAIAEILDPNKVMMMMKFGFNPIDEKATKKAGVTVMKDLQSVIKGIITATKGDEMKLGMLFGQRSIRAFARIAQEFRETGKFGELDTFIKQGGDGAETMKDFAFWSEQTKVKIGDLTTQASKFANKNLAGPIDALNKALTFLNNHPALTKGGLYGLLGLGALAVGGKIIGSIANIIGGLTGRGGKGLPGIAGGFGGLAGGKGPIPVYVVNKHLSMLPGGYQFPGGGPDAPGGKIPSWAGNLGKVAGALGRVSMVVGAGVLLGKGISALIAKEGPLDNAANAFNKIEFPNLRKIGNFINELDAKIKNFWDRDAKGNSNNMNAKTNINALNSKLIDKYLLMESLQQPNKNSRPAPIVNNISIQIDKEGRVTNTTDNMNTKTNINALPRGVH